ncbi:hypothetical protein JZ751_009178 [Albula glossodonta]|uniref:EF-hand domain-containing protein n=1 Tax=Albula glossodonta TaxID=121402 RepID=A0A8T2N2G9_9TELE|nr:hypothetical protein JZ751_009178 [Albula glossodonta]
MTQHTSGKGMDQFQSLFLKLDKTKDGYIAVDELHREMAKIGIVSVDEKAKVFDVGESRTMPMEFTQEETDSGVWKRYILAAGVADAVSRTATAPIDRLKTQLQVYGSKALSQGFREMRSGGVWSMWQGNAVNVLKGTPQSTLQCLIYSQVCLPRSKPQCFTYSQMKARLQGPDTKLSVQQRFGLGCVSGAAAHALFYPLEVLKVRLNLLHSGSYNGVLGCAWSIYQNESIAAFYRGFKPSILCMIPYAGVECAVHQSIMSWAQTGPSSSSEARLFFFSFVAFASGQTASYPLAVIRTQQQAQAFSLNPQNSSALQGLTDIYVKHGIRGYYGGLAASFVRAVPCALLNYTLSSKLEMLLSSLE